jgi:hypothetical protein
MMVFVDFHDECTGVQPAGMLIEPIRFFWDELSGEPMLEARREGQVVRYILRYVVWPESWEEETKDMMAAMPPGGEGRTITLKYKRGK